jgi:membrane protein YdbS with pleckstrin-like domain
MAFDRKLLHEHEELVLDLRPHWWYMFEPVTTLVGAIILGIVVVVTLDGGWVDTSASWASTVLIVGALVWFAVRYVKWISTNFVVTTDRVVFRVGVIAKKGVEIPLERINTVFFSQSIFERLLGAGDVSIESGGETGKETFSDIRKPSAVQNEIYKQMELNNTRMYGGMGGGAGAGAHVAAAAAAAPAAPTPPSIPAQIAELDQLRQSGAISDAEYHAKKDELLKRM